MKPLVVLLYHVLLLHFQSVLVVVVALSIDVLPSFPLANNYDDSTASSSSSSARSSLSSPPIRKRCTIMPLQKQKIVYHRSPLLSSSSSSTSTTTTATTEQPHTALIILNAPLSNSHHKNSPSPLFQRLWDKAQIRICADGGANRLYALYHSTTTTTTTATTENNNNNNELIPDMICGDLDSLLPHVRDYYANLGVVIQGNRMDQDTNDLDKSLTAAMRQYTYDASSSSTFTRSSNNKYKKCHRFAIYGAFGGRFDQEMASMQALYKWNGYVVGRNGEHHDANDDDDNDAEPVSLWLYDDHTMACLLHANCENRIQLKLPPPAPLRKQQQQQQQQESSLSTAAAAASSQEQTTTTTTTTKSSTTSSTSTCTAADNTVATFIGEGPTCGLIPLGEPCESCTTTGFQWNLSNQSMKFGGLVSTSNRIILQPPKDDNDSSSSSETTTNVVTVVASSPLIFTAEVHCGRQNEWSS